MKHFAPTFSFTMLVGLLTIVFVATGPPLFTWVQEGYKPATIQMLRPESAGKDPEIGQLGLLPKLDKIATGKALVCVVVTDCAPCNQSRLEYAVETAAAESVSVCILVSSELSPEGAESMEEKWRNVEVLAVTCIAQDRWNIFFLPRVYAFDDSGAIAYVQDMRSTFDEGVRRAVAKVR